MGCKESTIRNDGTPNVNPAHLPPVPNDCWYAQPFNEVSPMPVTEFHNAHKGNVLFSSVCVPTRASEINCLPGKAPPLQNTFVLGEDYIYGMGYLHNTALFIEHHWRTRVEHNPPKNKFERPFYDCLVGVQVYINNILIPDCAPHKDSLMQCTYTLRAPEAVSVWRAVPVILCGDPTHFTLSQIHVYNGLVYSFLNAAQTLADGEHDIRVEIVYGCKSEADFCTQFISRGGCTLLVTPEGREKCEQLTLQVEANIEKDPPKVRQMDNVSEKCLYCHAPLQYVCTTCGAHICGTPRCVWSGFVGYPFGCTSHKTVVE